MNALYKGFVVSCIGIFVYRGIYLGGYEILKALVPGTIRDKFTVNFLMGWLAIIGAGFVSYPLDTIKRRMIINSDQRAKYGGAIHCGMELINNEGAATFFKGFGANIIRGAVGAVTLVLYDKYAPLFLAEEHGGGM